MQWQQDSNGSNGQFDCAQMIAACVVLLVVNNNARGSDVGLVEFVKEYCIKENIGILGVLLLSVPK